MENGRLHFDKSPDIGLPVMSTTLKDWHLSFNEANITNYTRFGVKSKQSKSISGGTSGMNNPGGINPTFAQSFFHKRLLLKSAFGSDLTANVPFAQPAESL